MHIVEQASALPMDTASRMQRAKELGFTILAYHGTGSSFKAFDLNKGKAGTINGHAPHFTDSKAEALGYAKDRPEGRGKTLQVLLRVRKPFIVDLHSASHRQVPYREVPHDEYERLVGEPFVDKWTDKPTAYTMFSNMQNAIARMPDMEYSREDANNRRRWTEIYRRLMAEGYDAIVWPDTPADHSVKPYGKYILFEPKNVRVIKAAFDPAESESSNLMA